MPLRSVFAVRRHVCNLTYTIYPVLDVSPYQELQQGETPSLKRRRAIIGLSLIGIGAMAAVSLLQTRIVKDLPVRHMGR
jgi:hypothetical protein